MWQQGGDTRCMGEIPSITTNRTMANLYRVYVLLDGKRIMSTLQHAANESDAISKAQQEGVKIRSSALVTYTAAPITA